MAETKKTVNVTPAAKAVAAQAADTKTEAVETAQEASVAEVKSEEPKKTTRKTGAKKTTAKKAPAKKTAAAKKTTTKTTTTKKDATKKTAVKETLSLQFAGKSYTTEDLVKIAKDVWKYDLKQKVGDFKSVELYVKPEESAVYYVINGDVTGKFDI